jgi:hypothetical protein
MYIPRISKILTIPLMVILCSLKLWLDSIGCSRMLLDLLMKDCWIIHTVPRELLLVAICLMFINDHMLG